MSSIIAKKIEVMAIHPMETWDDIDEYLKCGIHVLNTYPTWIEQININGTNTPLGLVLDFPHNKFTTDITYSVIKYHINKYHHLIKHINIPLDFVHIQNEDWNGILKYLETLTSIKSGGIDYRLILDLAVVNDDAAERILNVAEQTNISSILITNFIGCEDEDSFNDYLIDINHLSKNISIPVGIFGEVNSKERLEKVIYSTLDPIVVDISDVPDILGK